MNLTAGAWVTQVELVANVFIITADEPCCIRIAVIQRVAVCRKRARGRVLGSRTSRMVDTVLAKLLLKAQREPGHVYDVSVASKPYV